MKFKHLAMLAAFATISLPAITHVAHAEGETLPAASPTADATAESNEFKMFRFATRMDKLEFIKRAMHLNADQEKAFLAQYDRYDIELASLNDERLSIIKDYAANFEKITDKDADKLVKRSLAFRKQRTALLEKYYAKMAKATSKVVAARFLQVEAVLHGAGDVVIGSSIPLMEK